MKIFKTVHSKISMLVIMFFILAICSFLATYITVQIHFWEENTVEIVHGEIPIVQKLSSLAVSDGNRAEIDAAMSAFDQNLNAVRASVRELDSKIPFLHVDDVYTHINELDEAWNNYKGSLNLLTSLSLDDPLRGQAEQSLRLENQHVFDRIGALTYAVESQSNSRHDLLLRIQVAFVIVAGTFTVLGYLTIRQRVVKPLSTLTNATQRIQQGSLTEPLEIPGEDEIAQLARSFDQMRKAILVSQTDLEKRIRERTTEIMTAFEFSQEIVSQHDINALVQSAVEKARTLMHAKEAFLCLVTPDGCTVELASSTGFIVEGKKLAQPIGNNLPDMTVNRGQGYTNQVSSFGCAFLRQSPEDQCLSTSLHLGEKVIGALCVTRDKNQPFSEEESRAFSLLANSATIAILNARYVEQGRQRAHKDAVLLERERLASELHDNLAQTLNLVNLKVTQLENKVNQPADHDAQDEVVAVRTNVQAAIEQVRMLAGEMASATRMQEASFLSQLELRLKEFEAASACRVELYGTEIPVDFLPALAQKQLMMIISEALTNIQRHAEARQVAIRFHSDQKDFHMTIEDDGKGFEPVRAAGDQHLGLRIMRTRAERSGGSLHLESNLGAGTRLTVTYPITVQEPG